MLMKGTISESIGRKDRDLRQIERRRVSKEWNVLHVGLVV